VCRSFVNCLPEILSGLLYSYLHPLSGADEVHWEYWQLVTVIHDENSSSDTLWVTSL
jgi:hypothetical protein